jgi:hypothetical protein
VLVDYRTSLLNKQLEAKMMPVIPWIQPRKTLVRKQQHFKKSNGAVKYIVLLSVLVFLLANLFFLSHVLHDEEPLPMVGGKGLYSIPTHTLTKSEYEHACSFRHYPPRRYYKLPDSLNDQPDFLTGSDVDYIYGQWPLLLQAHSSQRKLCVDQSEWIPTGTTTDGIVTNSQSNSNSNELPFADGTNPSILTVEHIQRHQKQFGATTTENDASSWLSHYPTVAYVATTCMTNSQCRWKDSESEIQEYGVSRQDEPVTVRTVILLLDADFRRLAQATLYLERDAQWGKRVKAAFETDTGGKQRPVQDIKPFDDARLFLHAGKIWVSYREGKGFGWDAQVLNPIHFNVVATTLVVTTHTASTLTATLKASETENFCCGRNMALMENLQQPSMLQSLTWVDPVTVIDVPTTRHSNTNTKQSPQRRRLADDKKKVKKKKSHIHGTNAFMVYLPDRNEFLGMGHFHRPTGRDPNDYARFGHHYTHTLFTVSAQPPFELKTLSQEFVLQSPHHPDDAEIIQFASGLEVSGDKLVVAYGVNDCEAGVMLIELKTLQDLLKPVEPGKQVVDYMRPLTRP